MSFKRFRSALAFALIVIAVCEIGVSQDGAGVETIVPMTNNPSGWKSFEVMTRGATFLPVTDVGDSYVPGEDSSTSDPTFAWDFGTSEHSRWDGLGAYRSSPNNLRVFVNHEVELKSTITSIDLNINNLISWVNQVSGTTYAGSGQVVTGIENGFSTIDTASGASGTPRAIENDPLSRFCSGTVYLADSFGAGLGFANDLYLTCEEVSGGTFFALDVSTNTLYEAPALGTGRWENAALIDTSRTDTVALLLSEDAGADADGSAPMQLYVGVKVSGGNFLEANGLVGGTMYYWNPAGTNTNGTTNSSGIFEGMSNGGTVAGTWTTSDSGAALFSKGEDVHTNPANGTEVVLACEREGVFLIDFSDLEFTQGGLGTNKATEIKVLFNARVDNGGLNNMDNLVWSDDGMIYINEDGNGNDIFSLDPTNGTAVQLLDGVGSETAGITDISDLVGFGAGSIFLSNSYNGASSNGSNSSLHLLVSPTAFMLPVGDFDADGDVDGDDVDFYIGNLNEPATGSLAQLDLNGDGDVTIADHNLHVTTLVVTSNGVTGALLGDVNLDGTVDVLVDAFALVGSLGQSVTSRSQGDLNADGTVDVLGDAFILVSQLGESNAP